MLIIVDYQNDFVNGVLGFPESIDLEDRIVSKIEEYRKNNEMIIFTKDCHDENYLQTQEGKRLPIPHCIDNCGKEIYGKVAKYCNEENTVIKKAFGSLDLAARLSFYQIDEIEICGLLTNICVLFNAAILKSQFPEARIIIDAKCVASNDKELHEKTLDVLSAAHIDVINR